MSPFTVRTTAITYGGTIRPPYVLSGNPDAFLTSVDTAHRQISRLKPEGGMRKVGNAIRYVCDRVMFTDADGRIYTASHRFLTKILVVISSGSSQDSIPSYLSCFNQTHNRDNNVAIIGIGVGSGGLSSLRNHHITSLLRIDKSSQLEYLDNDLLSEICKVQISLCSKAKQDVLFLIDG